jgi:hypothetical protein
VLESRVPDPVSCPGWVDWFVGISLSFRRAVLHHRNAAPILLGFMPRNVVIWNYELGADGPVPGNAHGGRLARRPHRSRSGEPHLNGACLAALA